MTKIKVSDFICKNLASLTGSKHAFLLSGGGMMHLLDSLAREESLDYICMHHEQACSIAADAYGRTKNSTSILFVTSGPGVTNAVTGVAGAFLDSTPMIVISGQVSRASSLDGLDIRQRGFQEIDAISLVSSITKYAKKITNPSDIKTELSKAAAIACTGRPGPVWLDIPLDVQASTIEIEENDTCPIEQFHKQVNDHLNQEKEKLSNFDLDVLLDELKKASRPLLVIGHGVKLSKAQKEIHQLINLLKIPVQNTWNSLDIIHEDHELYFGRANAYGPRYANIIIQNADLILSIGARLGIQHTGYNVKAFARNAKLFMIDIDENEINKPDLNVYRGLNIDAKVFIDNLLSNLASSPVSSNLNSWLNYCKEVKSRFPVYSNLEELTKEKITFVDPYYFVRELASLAPDDSVAALGSSGTCFTVSGQTYAAKEKQTVFNSKGLASMGYGLPSVIGAAIASPNKTVFTVVGDGGLMLNIQELQTIKHYRLPVKIFILNNQGYHAIRITQNTYFNGIKAGSDEQSGVSLPSYKDLSEIFNFKYQTINTNDNVITQINECLTSNQAVICEVFIDPDKALLPKLSSYKKEDGSMVSRPLEDLAPLLDRNLFKELMISEKDLIEVNNS
ncbi:MAG: thiamine pyrophosphate-binding protein [Candidatus Caenarcaniphilales bacterium]|nr:thiamine pyrophosphate-binding protein [Candidatus Caenarcaniphilales bacterium]